MKTVNETFMLGLTFSELGRSEIDIVE